MKSIVSKLIIIIWNLFIKILNKLVYNQCICMVQLKKITIIHMYGFKLYSFFFSFIIINFNFF